MEAAKDSRKYPRINLKAFAAISAYDKGDIMKEANSACINISEGGCCIELNASLSGADIDFGIKVGIDVPDGEPRLLATGRIAWLKEENRQEMTKYLIGVEFDYVKAQDRMRIRKYIQKLAETEK